MPKAKTNRAPAKTTARRAAKGAKNASRKTAKRAAPATPKPQTLTPYVALPNAAEAIDWYRKVFGAKELARHLAPEGRIMHAALQIGDSQLFLSDIFPGSDMGDPTRTAPTVNLSIWSRNADKWWKNATENGAKVTMPLADQFWGDRYGRFLDPFGHSWAISTKSKLPKAELEKMRVEAMRGFGASG